MDSSLLPQLLVYGMIAFAAIVIVYKLWGMLNGKTSCSNCSSSGCCAKSQVFGSNGCCSPPPTSKDKDRGEEKTTPAVGNLNDSLPPKSKK
ncbi:hypothetical protein [Methanolapillus millepedarum]|uniref:FeoB-associated Cys-rich membrane protein n=1 Tax=Methanolapillus millepedarum TaxID=3028296 RepID=A0AA96VAQ1_9EURY|nr:hypothetical protein MsAc7_01530 [Methanosarcinaceae archaeon Ac7]